MMLNEQVIVVTGAAGLIGSAISRAIVAEGGQVVIVDIDESRLTTLCADLGADHSLALCADASTVAGVNSVITATISHFGQLDAAVHSAYPRSAGWGTPFEALTAEYLNEDLSRQLGGAILFSQGVLQQFKHQGYGNLIHISSIKGIAAPKFNHYVDTSMTSPIEYSAIKAGLIAITRYLAKYYKGNNIRVNCVSPGGILDQQPDSFLQKYRESCNDKGMLDAQDVVGAILFLLSEHSKYVTGQNIVVDDGWSL